MDAARATSVVYAALVDDLSSAWAPQSEVRASFDQSLEELGAKLDPLAGTGTGSDPAAVRRAMHAVEAAG